MDRGGEGHDRLFLRIREIRADVKALASNLGELETAAGQESGTAPSASLKAKLKSGQAALAAKELGDHVAALKQLEQKYPEVEIYGDRVGDVRNAIEAVADGWPEKSLATVSEVKTQIAVCAERLAAARFASCQLTIGEDLERELSTIRVGKPLDFEELKAQLPDQAQRTQILSELSERQIGGWVDLKSGLIYKLSGNPTVRLFTYLAPLLATLLAAGILVGIANLKHLGLDIPKSWHLDDGRQLVGAFVLVLAGALIHLAVENVKQLQSGAGKILAISDGLDWLHLRWVGLSLSVVPILITVVGLRVLGEQSAESEVALYLFAGYSADSIAGLLLTRFDSSAGAMQKRLEKMIKAEAGAGAGS